MELSYRQEPYEWVYDGLSPLLLDAVAGSCEGIHISLAALYCAVGRRLACSILPEIARPLEGKEQAILLLLLTPHLELHSRAPKHS